MASCSAARFAVCRATPTANIALVTEADVRINSRWDALVPKRLEAIGRRPRAVRMLDDVSLTRADEKARRPLGTAGFESSNDAAG